ncbi:glycogen synthase [Pontibacillus litoralis]|uniref:Glycogen synthase n=1 Tax=Pontibacillus litoralis JSM 072002 TaxID=1385512 RepID=A0A0A5GAD5_9BACI|nr:glycogen/starch synthase [Pontibacillus litoralis]KGX88158.1 glycogen synthase [Pontibacillus litoralis JSM 072002]
MKVLFVATESIPFVKTGGLADVIGSLPVALQQEGVDVRVIIPKHKSIEQHYQNQMTLKQIISVPISGKERFCSIEEINVDGVHYYFVENDYYFCRDEVYGDAYQRDEAERFAYFSKAVLESLPVLEYQPDIIHCHDWQTALIPLFLRTHYACDPFYMDVKTMFTIHSMQYQGIFPKDVLTEVLDLDWSYFTSDQLEFYGHVNYMKAGLLYADRITTVSDSYAKAIQTTQCGCGLEGIVQQRARDIVGIPCGVSRQMYHPNEDMYLYTRRGVYDWKADNKRFIQQTLSLPIREVPMLVTTSRLVEHKGMDVLLSIMGELLEEDIQFVVLGMGEERYEQALQSWATRYPDKLSVQLTFSESLARQLYAACDLFLMPSLSEPRGLSAMIAMSYEAVPVTRETGALKDIVHSFDEESGEGNGFTFRKDHELIEEIKRGLYSYQDPFIWWLIQQNIKKSSFDWKQASFRYKALYDQVKRFSQVVSI